ncbi:kinase-like domain-containing protein [Rhodocollybia butyracea]|uniref:Kinase-like domain-containing protein n=1 Tax=Rhodocollybia butyracea TaxID=206335 RepID=A0A9P5PHA0_9AGAR|nr:kinase-like domain-containing protein [Rhodocollybia butyracea]
MEASRSKLPSTTWTLDRVKTAISRGTRISNVYYGVDVVDIGDGYIVKFGTSVTAREAEATELVATHTSIPVARIHATLYDEVTSITYIVQDRIHGERLDKLLPTLDAEKLQVIEKELQFIFSQLSSLDTHGSMGMVGKPTYFLDFHPFAPDDLGSWRATTALGFVTWIIDATNISTDVTVFKPIDSDIFDNEKPHIFSHGDLVPENILVHDGHISGIIDWEYAGWYPYFWNAYIALRRPFVDSQWKKMIRNTMVTYNREREVFSDVYATASLWVGT